MGINFSFAGVIGIINVYEIVEPCLSFPQGPGFSLSVYNAGQILKIGTSSDCGVCKGKRKDGMACTVAINKYVGDSFHLL